MDRPDYLSRQTETTVHQRLSRKPAQDPCAHQKAELRHLREALDIAGAAAPVEVVVDLNRRTVDVGMTLRAPEDRKSSRARVNWLLRQVRAEKVDDIQLRLNWPGRSEATQFSLVDLRADPGICEIGKQGVQVLSFHLFAARRLGGRFIQQVNFITDLEAVVSLFCRDFGQNLVAWRKPAPRIREEPAPDPVEET